MLQFEKFTGINNVLPSERLSPSDLKVATNVDIGLTGELHRRKGFTALTEVAHHNLFDGPNGLLATVGGNADLMNVTTNTVLYPSLGHDRVWYAKLPDDRVAFSNGLICGLTDGVTATTWGVPIPYALGATTEMPGDLFAGSYRYALTYVRKADGLEGAPRISAPFEVSVGGLFFSGLPVEDDYRINVYLTSHNDDALWLAGSTDTGVFTFTGTNDDLVLPCRTSFTAPAMPGCCLTFWNSRVLVAVGSVLYASRPFGWETFDLRRDFKQFEAPITTVVAVDDGLYVGTERELAFLAGSEFDKLQHRTVVDGRVVLGSGVAVRGELVKQGEGAGLGSAMICIANKHIVAGFNGGGVLLLTEGRYETDVSEVFAAFRKVDDIPQYVAIPR